MQQLHIAGHRFTSSCPSISRQREINGLLAGAEFWLSQDDKGRILGNLRLNPATTNPHTVTILLGLLNDKVGRHRVWYTHPRHGWRHICWRCGSYSHFWSLQKRCEESNIESQRRDTIELMERQWQDEQPQQAPPELVEPQEPEQPAPARPENEWPETENVWFLRAKAHKAINSMNVEQLQAFFTLVEAAKSPRPSQEKRGTSIANSLPEPEMPTRPARTKASSKAIASNRPNHTRVELEAMTIRQLKKLAVGTGIKRYSRLRKAQLVQALLDWQLERQYELELDRAHHILSRYKS